MLRTAKRSLPCLLSLLLLGTACTSPVTNSYGADKRALAREARNPISKVTKVGIQNNGNFGVGVKDEVEYVGNVEISLPVALDDDFNVINQFRLPVTHQPEIQRGDGDQNGIGNLEYRSWFSLDNDSGGILGFGPVLLFPTNSDDRLGADAYSAGFGVLTMRTPGNWMVGMSGSNVWDIPGSLSDDNVDVMLVDVFLNYLLDDGWYLTATPEITADWKADKDDKWTIPIGGGFGRVVEFGSQPANFSLQAFWNAETPETTGGDWSIVFGVDLLYTKRGFQQWAKKDTPN